MEAIELSRAPVAFTHANIHALRTSRSAAGASSRSSRSSVPRRDDLDYVVGSCPYISFGTPDFMVERIRRSERLGDTEVPLRIDEMGHDVHMRSIETFGKT